jgi:tRNA(Ile)-lysidine synthase
MDSTILSLTWPDGFDPNDFKRFETEARALRYQALGRACRAMWITRLMLAHHADDQAETVMMRLANNRLRSGLQAMQHKEWIPECEGIYGVYHSGRHQKPNRHLDIPFPVEQGGIQIYRPLLTFEKRRLIATCEDKGVDWVEDKTNQIRTLTSRNTIRHIYKNHKLPEALSVESLVNVSQHMQERITLHKTLANKLFDRCLIKLDIQTGCLIVRFPPISDLLGRPIKTKADKVQAKNTAYCLLERVAELITPRFKTPLGQLAATAYRIYPELEDLEEDEEPGHWNGVRKKNYCVYSVWWRFWGQRSPFDKHEHREEGINLDTNERADAENHMVYPPVQSVPRPERNYRYRLFDGRYWIHLRNRLTHDTLVLRIFSKDDMHHLPTYQENRTLMQESDANRPFRFIMAALDLLKPADLRFTLPAVFRIDCRTGEESLVGFPTLDVRTHGFGAPAEVCEWSVRYKKIDFGSRAVDELIVPGISRKDIIAEEMKGKPVLKGIKRVPMKKERKR